MYVLNFSYIYIGINITTTMMTTIIMMTRSMYVNNAIQTVNNVLVKLKIVHHAVIKKNISMIILVIQVALKILLIWNNLFFQFI